MNLNCMNMHSEKRKIICYGDSNTFGHDPRSFIGDRYPPDARWTELLKSEVRDTVNLGLNGRQIPYSDAELSAAEKQIAAYLPAELVIVMLGTNDLLWNSEFRAEDAAARMETFLRRLLPVVGRERLLLLSPPAMQNGSWVEDTRLITESKRLGALYAALAAELSVAFADSACWDIALSYDGIHLTESGHRVFADRLQLILENVFHA